MVVLSAAIATKGGKTLVARQFQDIPKLRVEGLLAAFPKLVGGSDKNHTYLETESVRYLYTPLEQFYVIIITNKASNILEDLETLQLIYQVTIDFCRIPDEEDIIGKAFDLVFAYDEVISGGYREKVTMHQIHQYLEMDSQDERLYEMIEKSKRREAKEEAKRRQHQIEQERRERYDFPTGGQYNSEPVSHYRPPPTTATISTPPVQKSAPPPKKKTEKRGMSLGPVAKKNQFLEELEDEIESAAPPQQEPEESQQSIPQPPQQNQIEERNVHLVQEEKVVVSLVHDGPVSMEVKGDISILINDSNCNRVYTTVVKPVKSAQYRTHPNIDKNRFAKDNVLVLKNPGRPLPTGSPLGVLKYRLVSDREEDLPLVATCWPTPNGDGTTSCIVECEVQQPHMKINFIEIHIPTSSFSPTVENVDGIYQFDGNQGVLMWRIPSLGGEEEGDRTSASMEFKIPYEGDISGFFPIRISFTSTDSIPGFQIQSVNFVDDNNEAPFSVDRRVEVENYEIIHQ